MLSSGIISVDAAKEPVVEWEKKFGGSGQDWGYSVKQTSDGGYIIAGITESYGAGKKDVYLIKTDSDGNKLWQRTFGGSQSDGGYSVQQTTDGGYIVTGFTRSYGAGYDDIYLIKTDSDGNKLWQRTFGGSQSDGGRSVQQTTDGGYIVAGTFHDDFYLLKTDAQGNKIWDKTYYDGETAYSVQQTTDGGYIAVGATDGWLCWGLYLIKTDSQGNKIWDNEFECQIGTSVQQTSDGGFIIASSYEELIKTNAKGDLEWKTGAWTDLFSVQQTSDGGYVATGDWFLIKTDPEGNVSWRKNFEEGIRGYSRSVQQTSDQGYIVTGWTGFSNPYLAEDVYLVKFKDDNPPVASFTHSPANPLIDKKITFNASSSYDPDGTILSYKWDFGDASLAEGAIVAHNYTKSGIYKVKLTVIDNDGLNSSQSSLIKVKGHPFASFTYSPESPFQGEKIIFNGSNSSDDGEIIKYEWNFGDGNIGEVMEITHTYNKIGSYTVTLTVTDNDGLKNSLSRNITIKCPCSKTNTLYGPKDTKCNGKWPDHEGSTIHINEDNYVCDLFEVCDESLDPIIKEAEDCCRNACNGNCHSFCANAYDSSTLRNGYSDSKFKKCKGLYLVYGLGPSKRFMQDYYYPEIPPSDNPHGCPGYDLSFNCGFDAGHLMHYPNAAPLKCQGIVNQPNGWVSDSDLTKNSCIFSDLPAHASINKISTGTCVDYSTSLTTLLRKAGFSLDEVYSVTGPCHEYNLVKFSGNRKWVIVDTVGNSPNTYKPGDKPGWSWRCNGMIYDHCDYYFNSCANDNGATICPPKENVYGCGIRTVTQSAVQYGYQNDLNSSAISTNKTFNNLVITKTTSKEIRFGSVLEVNISVYNNGSLQHNITIKEIVENAIPIDPAELNMEQIPEGLIAALPPFYYWNFSLDPYNSKLISYKIKPLNPGEYILSGTKIFTEENTTETDYLIINVLCNQNKVCEPSIGENYFTCKYDCPSGAQDDICDLEIEGVCDLDCLLGIDPDCSIFLQPGWSLISIPLNLSNNSVSYLFNNINITIYGYKNNSWFVPNEINNRLAYWIKLNQSLNLTLIGNEIENKTIKLNKEWNLIGYPSLNTGNVSVIFDSIKDNLTNVFSYENSSWKSYSFNKPDYLNSLKEMKPGLGYWIKSKENIILEFN